MVALTQGECAVVSPGDVLTFDWNPQFDSSAAVGVKNFSLVFAGQSAGEGRRTPNNFVLRANSRENRNVASPMVATGGGFFRFSFRIDAHISEPGTYHLARAEAEPVVVENYQGDAPQITNSPNRSWFCLQVTRGAAGGN